MVIRLLDLFDFKTGSVRTECFFGLFCRTQVLENYSDDLFQPQQHKNIVVQLSA